MVREDLGLIPLLHNYNDLEAKIALTISQVTKVKPDLTETCISSTVNVSEETIRKLREMIASMVDGSGGVIETGSEERVVEDARRGEEILSLLIGSLPSAEIGRCLEDASILLTNCRLAMSVLRQRKERDQGSFARPGRAELDESAPWDNGESSIGHATVGDQASEGNRHESIGLGSSTSSAPEVSTSSTGMTSHESSSEQPLQEVLEHHSSETSHHISRASSRPEVKLAETLERGQNQNPAQTRETNASLETQELSIESLSQLTFGEIIHHLRSFDPAVVYERIGIPRQSALEIGLLVRFQERLEKMSSDLDRRTEIIKKIAEKIEVCTS